jgi:hypothetical protein
MTVERDSDFEPWPGEPDSINTALMPLIEHIFAMTADGSAERSKAMGEVLAAVERLKRALRPAPRLN